MSEAMTEVYAGEEAAFALHGHVDPAEAIRQTRAMLITERQRCARQLALIDEGKAHVYHQRGVYVATNRRRVGP